MRVTDTWLRTTRAHQERYDVNVDGRQGLVVRIHPSGAKSFRLRYMRNGERRWFVLGEYGDGGLSLADAFEMHLQAQRELAKGLDPIEEHRRRQEDAEKARQRRTATNAVTIRNLIAEWAWHYARRERKRPREAVRLLKVHLLAPLAGKPASEITKRDLVRIVDPVLARGANVMANRLRDLIVPFFAFAAERDLIPSSPAAGLRKKPGGDEDSKERALTREEINTFWHNVDAPTGGVSQRLALALKLILVTAQRPGEIIKARFDQFDFKQRVWTIPPETIKTVKKAKRGKKKQARAPRVHCVPLTDLAMELVEELRTLAKDRPCLLPAQRSKRNPNGHIEEKGLAHALRDEIDEKAGTLFGFEPFTPHDLRRTAATMMTSLGIPRHPDVAKVLNHAEDDDDTTGIYDRWEYWPQKQKALTVWETELRAIIEGKSSVVVPLAKRA